MGRDIEIHRGDFFFVCVVLFLSAKGRMGVVCVWCCCCCVCALHRLLAKAAHAREAGEALTVRESAKCCAPMHRQSSAADLFRPQAHALLSIHPPTQSASQPSTQQATPGRPPPPPQPPRIQSSSPAALLNFNTHRRKPKMPFLPAVSNYLDYYRARAPFCGSVSSFYIPSALYIIYCGAGITRV